LEEIDHLVLDGLLAAVAEAAYVGEVATREEAIALAGRVLEEGE
jgi:hypothetical protein